MDFLAEYRSDGESLDDVASISDHEIDFVQSCSPIIQHRLSCGDIAYVATYAAGDLRTAESKSDKAVQKQSNDLHDAKLVAEKNEDVGGSSDCSVDDDSTVSSDDASLDSISEEQMSQPASSNKDALKKKKSKEKKKLDQMLTEEEMEGAPTGPPRTKNELPVEEILAAEKYITGESIFDCLNISSPDNANGHQDESCTSSNAVSGDSSSVLQAVGKVMYRIDHESTVVIEAAQTTMPLNEGSIICSENGVILGRISEVFGPISKPFYVVRWVKKKSKPEKKIREAAKGDDKQTEEQHNEGDSNGDGAVDAEDDDGGKISSIEEVVKYFSKGATAYAAKPQCSFILPTTLTQAYKKGSDASNVHDEEVCQLI